MNNYTVYMHISPNEKKYIGITSIKPEYRWNKGKGYKNKHFTNAIKKYGWDNFKHIIIAKGLTEEEAKWLEIELIRIWDSTNSNKGYNISLGGDIVSEETKKKISENRSGENHHMFGKHHTEETKEKISKAIREKDRPNAKTVILLNTKEIFLTITEGMNKYNISSASIISQCCNGERKSAGKLEDGTPLVWMLYNEYLNITEEEIQNKLNEADIRVICITTNKIFPSAVEGAKEYNIYPNNISQCCNGKLKSAGKHPLTKEKLIWMLYKDYLKFTKDK